VAVARNFAVQAALSVHFRRCFFVPSRVIRCWICSVASSMDYALATRPQTPGLRMAGAFTFGIEEEYFLVDAETKSLVRKMPQAFLEAAKAAANGRISTEYQQQRDGVIC